MRGKNVVTRWEVWEYDVWGNDADGYEVNDRVCINHSLEITLNVTVNNPGTPQEFASAYPTNRQIRKALLIKPRVKLDLDGDDVSIYVAAKKNGYPLGDLLCVSHGSLSPISATAEKV